MSSVYVFGCPDHGSLSILDDYNTGDAICTMCGYVVSTILEDGRLARKPAHDSSTTDSSSQRAPAPRKSCAQKTSPLTHAKPDDTAASMLRARVGDVLAKLSMDGLTTDEDLVESCVGIFTIIRSFKGRPTACLLAVAIFVGMKNHGTPRMFKEIGGIVNVKERDIGRCYKAILKHFSNIHDAPKVGSYTLINRLGGDVGISNKEIKRATEYAIFADKLPQMSKRNILSLAAASVYIVLKKYNKSKIKTLAERAGVALTTIKQSAEIIEGSLAPLALARRQSPAGSIV